jgi:hypothetical protein
MADDRGEQTAKKRFLPEGATNLHKNMASGRTRPESEAKALTKEQVAPKER